MITIIFLLKSKWVVLVMVTGYMLINIFFEFLLPIGIKRDGKNLSYEEKFRIHDNREGGRFERSYYGTIISQLGWKKWVIWGVMVFYSVTFYIGEYSASRQKEFLILKTTPESVVLRIYGEYFISAPFDKTKKEVEPKFTYQKVSQDPPLTAQLEKIGPLKVKEL
jgi:hypothetical protein